MTEYGARPLSSPNSRGNNTCYGSLLCMAGFEVGAQRGLWTDLYKEGVSPSSSGWSAPSGWSYGVIRAR
jgi:hypothetical protein